MTGQLLIAGWLRPDYRVGCISSCSVSLRLVATLRAQRRLKEHFSESVCWNLLDSD